MRLIPKTTFKLQTRTNGYKYAIIYREWLWTTTLFEFPISLEFWPRELKIPRVKGVRYPKEPEPTEEEISIMADFVRQRAYRVLCKFWNWRLLGLNSVCVNPTEDHQVARGMFIGFTEAKCYAEKIAGYGSEAPQEEEQMEDESDMYLNQQRMDKIAESEL